MICFGRCVAMCCRWGLGAHRVDPNEPTPVVGNIRHSDEQPDEEQQRYDIRRQDGIGHLQPHV